MMKKISFAVACLLTLSLNALEYEVQLDNDLVHVGKATIQPHEEIGLHRDANPQVVVALKGGTITRLEADGSTKEVCFPTGVAVFREVDPPGELHGSINHSDESVELLIIQLKTE